MPPSQTAPDLRDQTILVTGGTGSFGKTVVERLLDTECAEIRILSRDELKQHDMRQEFSSDRLRFFLGDVRDRHSVDQAMNKVDLVFHAAALKQVPSCEFFPQQAVMTNVLGSGNVVESAIAHGVRSVVCLSTDKAAYPINAMGQSKALMEKMAVSPVRMGIHGDTTISVTRYGNVMYSRGSVIPLFVRQLREGGPVTITDPRMSRFLMPLREAVDLVLYAFEHARPGDLFVRKAVACTIQVLADALKELLGVDCPTKTIGIRHGEKLYETLVTSEEMGRAEDLGDYFRIPLDTGDLRYSLYFTEGSPEGGNVSDFNSMNVPQLDIPAVKELLLQLPEIQRDLESAGRA